MEIRFTNYKSSNNNIQIICCDRYMKIRDGKQKHHNDNPFTMRCEKCGKGFKCNAHAFDCPRPAHAVIELKEIKKQLEE